MSVSKEEFEDLRRRLTRLEDIEAIRRVKATYLNACDSQNPELAASCFAEGKIAIDMGHVGVLDTREKFAELYRMAGCHPHILDMHHGVNSEIEFSDDTHAKALWALEYRNINTKDKSITFLSAVYHDEYAKIGGQWKITKTRTDFKTALHTSYVSGKLETLLVGKSVAGAVEYPKVDDK